MPRYIDAEALMQKFCKQCGVKDREYFCHAHCGDRMIIESIPTADVQSVKHGRWMYPFYCSECGFTPYYSSDLAYNYCPNCGARMDGDGQ